ncbi:hypothetical protein KCP73_12815 [Salmonella enterica subsp. enterica]|nr:hypothetical protein KCP73_12815 [Salmonella enterica subsp. enterica]
MIHRASLLPWKNSGTRGESRLTTRLSPAAQRPIAVGMGDSGYLGGGDAAADSDSFRSRQMAARWAVLSR